MKTLVVNKFYTLPCLEIASKKVMLIFRAVPSMPHRMWLRQLLQPLFHRLTPVAHHVDDGVGFADVGLIGQMIDVRNTKALAYTLRGEVVVS
jgi:hypothetical protein